jgi:hypothetical protein
MPVIAWRANLGLKKIFFGYQGTCVALLKLGRYALHSVARLSPQPLMRDKTRMAQAFFVFPSI